MAWGSAVPFAEHPSGEARHAVTQEGLWVGLMDGDAKNAWTRHQVQGQFEILFLIGWES